MKTEGGQAAVEWVGLLLFVSLGLAALLSLAPRVEGRSLGAAVARAITCGAGGHCDQRVSGRPWAVAPPARPRRAAPPVRPPRAAPPAGVRPPVSPARAATAFRVLRGLRAVAAKAWIVCLGYKRFQYERRHPEMRITGRMPVREALRIANSCLNPADFVGEEG